MTLAGALEEQRGESRKGGMWRGGGGMKLKKRSGNAGEKSKKQIEETRSDIRFPGKGIRKKGGREGMIIQIG